MKIRNNKGFAHVEFLLIAVVILAVVGVGYYVLKARTGGIFNSRAETQSAQSKNKLSTNADTVAAERDYAFELQKDGKAVSNGATVSGPVVVGINMNVDRNLSNVKFYVDGVEKGSKPSIVKTGFRDFYTWHTKLDTNGNHTLTVKATNTDGKEFDVHSSATNTKSLSVKVDNGSDTKAPTSGSTGGTSGQAGGTSGSSTNTEVTEKLNLSIKSGPLDGVPGSQSGTIEGQNVTGGIVFVVKFKRPKAIQYDLKTMNIQVTKDGTLRFTMSQDSNSLDVKEEGNYKVYTFKRYYNTPNKPNGTSIWQAFMQPNPAVQPANNESNQLTLNINNSDSTAEATCKQLKSQVNDLFDTSTKRIDENQKRIVEVNQSIARRYQELGLAASNPIPNYDFRMASFNEANTTVDSLQTDLEANKIKCASATPEDIGAKVVAFKTQLEQAKGAVGTMNALTLDLLGDLRTRLPQGSNDGSSSEPLPELPQNFTRVRTYCYTFGLPDSKLKVSPSGSSVANNCEINAQYINKDTEKEIGVFVRGVNISSDLNAEAQLLIQRVRLNPAEVKITDTTVGGQPAKQLVSNFSENGDRVIYYIFGTPHSFITDKAGAKFENGAMLQFVSPNFGETERKKVDEAVASWQWKPVPTINEKDINYKKVQNQCANFDIPRASQTSGLDKNICGGFIAAAPYAPQIGQQTTIASNLQIFGFYSLKDTDDAFQDWVAKASGSTVSSVTSVTIDGQPGKVFDEVNTNRTFRTYFIKAPGQYKGDFSAINYVVISRPLVESSFSSVPALDNAFGSIALEQLTKSWHWRKPPTLKVEFSKQQTDCYNVDLPVDRVFNGTGNSPTSCTYTQTLRSNTGSNLQLDARSATNQTATSTLDNDVQNQRTADSRNATIGAAQSLRISGQEAVKYTLEGVNSKGEQTFSVRYLIRAPQIYNATATSGLTSSTRTLNFIIRGSKEQDTRKFQDATMKKFESSFRWKAQAEPTLEVSRVEADCFSYELPVTRVIMRSTPPKTERDCLTAYAYQAFLQNAFSGVYIAPGNASDNLQRKASLERENAIARGMTVGPESQTTVGGQPAIAFTEVGPVDARNLRSTTQVYVVEAPRAYTLPIGPRTTDAKYFVIFTTAYTPDGQPNSLQVSTDKKKISSWRWK